MRNAKADIRKLKQRVRTLQLASEAPSLMGSPVHHARGAPEKDSPTSGGRGNESIAIAIQAIQHAEEALRNVSNSAQSVKRSVSTALLQGLTASVNVAKEKVSTAAKEVSNIVTHTPGEDKRTKSSVRNKTGKELAAAVTRALRDYHNAKAKLGELRSLAAASHKNRRHGGDEEAESEKESLMEKAGIKFTQAKVGDCLFAAPSPVWPSLVSIAIGLDVRLCATCWTGG